MVAGSSPAAGASGDISPICNDVKGKRQLNYNIFLVCRPVRGERIQDSPFFGGKSHFVGQPSRICQFEDLFQLVGLGPGISVQFGQPIFHPPAFLKEYALAFLKQGLFDGALQKCVRQPSETIACLRYLQLQRLALRQAVVMGRVPHPLHFSPYVFLLQVAQLKPGQREQYRFVDALLANGRHGAGAGLAAVVDMPLLPFSDEGKAAMLAPNPSAEQEFVPDALGVGLALENFLYPVELGLAN